jgi:sialic acid synthase SpsE
MAKIIFDFGSGNTCKNKKDYIKNMYDELKNIDSGKHEIIVKWQLFEVAGPNIPLTREMFDYAYKYGNKLGYKVTSSVFDLESLNFLLEYKIPFVKIANNRMLDFIIDMIPKKIPVYISKSKDLFLPGIQNELTELWCISRYPATIEEYNKLPLKKGCNISDHTNDFRLFYEYNPNIIEWHYKLDYSIGLDAGDFARTPEQLKEIL